LTIGLIILGVGFLIYLIDKNIAPTNQLKEITFWIFILAFIPIGFAYIFQFFDYENIEISNKGNLDIHEKCFKIDYKKEILYSDIEDLSIIIDAYYDERINIVYKTPTEQKSLGLKNKIRIKTNYNSTELYFKLENKYHKNRLEEVLFEIITNEKLENLDPKKSIKLIPEKFKNSDKYKSYVIKQIVRKRIDCTEGLLLHGYKTDKEAKELREKYCG